VVEAGTKRFGISPKRVLAACVYQENGLATGRLIRVPTDELKAVAIREVIARPVHGVFGNSIHDQAMLEMARHPFAVNPSADLHEVAQSKQWQVYWPDDSVPVGT
ncbi:MAG TPA: haloacid dehalogenase-like hydrolase, partial [Candidatus Angelobacter sp.]|nr:haloacid dehalogenase-like hydrolase [Candidatus Angelobacter sp.]